MKNKDEIYAEKIKITFLKEKSVFGEENGYVNAFWQPNCLVCKRKSKKQNLK